MLFGSYCSFSFGELISVHSSPHFCAPSPPPYFSPSFGHLFLQLPLEPADMRPAPRPPNTLPQNPLAGASGPPGASPAPRRCPYLISTFCTFCLGQVSSERHPPHSCPSRPHSGPSCFSSGLLDPSKCFLWPRSPPSHHSSPLHIFFFLRHSPKNNFSILKASASVNSFSNYSA